METQDERTVDEVSFAHGEREGVIPRKRPRVSGARKRLLPAHASRAHVLYP